DGITLKEFMEQQKVLKWKDSVHFIIQILRALQHAHDRGIVHRDIKPQNIMLFSDGTIKVMDFGIARFAREEGKTISDKAIGSVHYISPEQASGNITDEKSDIYSVGVMLYEMLTGVKPFDADTPIAVALMHMQQTPRMPRSINDTIPEGLEAIVMRAMKRDASKRYQSASEMIKDIEEFRNNPSIVFEYGDSDSDTETSEKTMYFDKSAPAEEAKKETPSKPRFTEEPKEKNKKSRKNEVSKTKDSKIKEKELEAEEPDIDDDDEDEEVSKSSFFVVALTAIAAAVVIIAVLFIAMVFLKEFSKDVQQETMISLVGYDYNTCKSTYAEYFTLVVESEKYSSEYPAGVIIEHSPKEGSPIIKGNSEVRAVVSKGPQMKTVPNVYMLDASAAESMIKAEGLKPVFTMQNSDAAVDTVIKTEPERHTSVEVGSTVIVYVSLGPLVLDIIMPDVVGMTKAEAVALLEKNGFDVQLQEEDSVAPKDEITFQSIPHLDENGQQNIVSPDQTVILMYSSGKAPMTKLNITFAVPSNLTGKAVFNAYVNGNLSGTISVDNIGYVSTISLPVEGVDTQKVVLETVDADGNAYSFAEYNIDFNNAAVAEASFDKEVLKKVYGKPEVTTEPVFTGFEDDDSPEIIDNGRFDNWWNNIANGQ
ncbi:MAG: PASTA domain-containing protein, partial [Huintestinicola sp.]